MLKNMKVGVRLSIAFALVLILLGVVAVLSLMRLEQIKLGTDQIVNDRYPKIAALSELTDNMNLSGIALRDALLVEDAAQVKRFTEDIATMTAANAKLYEFLEGVLVSDEDQQQLQTIVAARDSYNDQRREVLNLAGAGLREQAELVLYEKLRPLLDTYTGELHKLVKAQAERMKADSHAADVTYEQSRKIVIALSSVAALLAFIAALWVTRSITIPLGEAAAVARRMAEGDLTMRVHSTSKDEAGLLLSAMGTMVEKLSGVIGEVRAAADSLSSASEEVSATAQSLSQASTEQSSSVEETSASVEQMTASIGQNTENSKVTDQMATKAAHEAIEGGDAVGKTVEAMNQIAQKISIIDDIAYQTNLLALNAAIEAARAGEHGKGFAVVAAEVRKLAERSQVAAQEIGEVASSSVQLAEKAGKLLDEMVPSIKKTSELVQEITAASQEQSSGVGQINSAMNQLSQLTQQNASSSEELASTAEEMSGQAQQLQAAMAFFRIDANAAARAAAATAGKAEPGAQPAAATHGSHKPRASTPAHGPASHGQQPWLQPLAAATVHAGHGVANGKANGHGNGAVAEHHFVRF